MAPSLSFPICKTRKNTNRKPEEYNENGAWHTEAWIMAVKATLSSHPQLAQGPVTVLTVGNTKISDHLLLGGKLCGTVH